MITYISIYMLTQEGTHPFVCIHRGATVRFYDLTKASARRLTYACRRSGGYFYISDQGWDWDRGLR